MLVDLCVNGPVNVKKHANPIFCFKLLLRQTCRTHLCGAHLLVGHTRLITMVS